MYLEAKLLGTMFYIIAYIAIVILEIYFIYWTIKKVKKNNKEIEELKNRICTIEFEKEQYKKYIAHLEDRVKYIEWKNGKTPE